MTIEETLKAMDALESGSIFRLLKIDWDKVKAELGELDENELEEVLKKAMETISRIISKAAEYQTLFKLIIWLVTRRTAL